MNLTKHIYALVTLVLFLLTGIRAGYAFDATCNLIQTINTSGFNPPSPDSSGIEYIPPTDKLVTSDILMISDAEVEEPTWNPPIYQNVNMFEATLDGSLVDTWDTTTAVANPPNPPPCNFSDEPTGVAYKPANQHLFISDDNKRKVFEIAPGSDRFYGRGPSGCDDVVTSFGTNTGINGLNSGDPEGLAYSPVEDVLFIADGVNSEVYRVTLGGTKTGQFDTAILGLTDPEGIGFDQQSGHLYIVGKPKNTLFEVSTSGALVRTIDISAANARKPAGVAVGPGSRGSADPNPGFSNVYIAERGVDNNSSPTENDGKVYECDVPPASGTNQPPSVSAGPDQAITLPSTAALDGTVSDDGLPNPPAAVTTTWSQVSGPGTVTFGNAAAVDTTASFSTAGTYVLQLTANDSALSASDQVQITVNAAAINQPPSVSAGPDQAITLPSTAALDGTVSDDGLPNPPAAVTTTWSQVSGPGTVTFGNAAAVDTTASFSTAGTYVLQLTANDSALSASDQVQITVNAVGTTLTFAPAADATIKFGSPTTNFGSATKLQVDNSPVTHFLIKFTVSGIGAGQGVQSAKLRLFNVNASNKGGDFYRVADSSWTETSVTWNNAPASDASAIASLGAVSTNTWYEVDVKSLVTGNGTYSLRVKSTSGDGADYRSKQAVSNAPQLVVTVQ